MKARYLIPAVVVLCVLPMAHAQTDEANPKETQVVLGYLLAAANQRVPPDSFCAGHYGQRGAARIRDVLGMQLAYFGEGQNRVVGKTTVVKGVQGGELRVTRANGDDVSSATFLFVVRNEMLVLDSLQCFMTP